MLFFSLILAAIVSFFIIRHMRSTTIPDIPELIALDGSKFDKGTLKDKVYIISFFQTWCSDCVKEQPELKKLIDHFGSDKLEVLLVSDEPMEKLKAFSDKFSSGLKILRTPKSLKGDLGVRAFPTTYLFSKEGKMLIKKVEGIDWYNSEIIDMIDGNFNQNKE